MPSLFEVGDAMSPASSYECVSDSPVAMRIRFATTDKAKGEKKDKCQRFNH